MICSSVLRSRSIFRGIQIDSKPHRRGRSLRLSIDQKLILRPIGDGSIEHLGGLKEAPSIPEVSLSPGVLEVGREKPADVVLPVPTVSARHALIRISETAVTVTDLESTNGTYINREQLEPMEATDLKVGGEVIFGDEHLACFVLAEEPVLDLVETETESKTTP